MRLIACVIIFCGVVFKAADNFLTSRRDSAFIAGLFFCLALADVGKYAGKYDYGWERQPEDDASHSALASRWACLSSAGTPSSCGLKVPRLRWSSAFRSARRLALAAAASYLG